MPADLTSSATLRELMLSLAVSAGYEDYEGASKDGAPTLPTSPDLLAKLKSYINKGMALVMREVDGTFLDFDFTLRIQADGQSSQAVKGDAARYQLPVMLRSQPRYGWLYTEADAPYQRLVIVAPDEIEMLRQAQPGTGWPSHASVRALPVSEFGEGAREVVFWPTPQTNATLKATFRLTPYPLVDLEQRHPCGSDHDESIIAAAWYLWQMDDETQSGKLASAERRWANALATSKRLEADKRPRLRGIAETPHVPTTNTRFAPARAVDGL